MFVHIGCLQINTNDRRAHLTVGTVAHTRSLHPAD